MMTWGRYLLFNIAVSNYWHYQDPANPL
eukprot:COSAG01_NODE_7041_length_3380_cov_6.993600_1_plen_27_part_10